MNSILRSGFLALAIMALAVPANAGPFEDGKTAYDRGDYTTALKFWRPPAKRGNAEAQFNLGFMYNTGNGVPLDIVFAYMWFNLAAAQNDLLAPAARDMAAERMTPNQIAEAQRMARKWMAMHRQ